jgi:hypothetical protein
MVTDETQSGEVLNYEIQISDITIDKNCFGEGDFNVILNRNSMQLRANQDLIASGVFTDLVCQNLSLTQLRMLLALSEIITAQ